MGKFKLIAVVLVGAFLGACESVSKSLVSSQNQEMESFVTHAKSAYDDPQVDAYMKELSNMVLASARRLDKVDDPKHERDASLDIYDRFDVHCVYDVAPNAFVTGDNFATVNTALLAMAESPEELVMILGHEFGHLRHEHLVQQMTNVQWAAGLGIAAQAAGAYAGVGTATQVAADQAAAVTSQVFLSPNPDKESESDATGVAIMADLGLDLQYADDFFVRMMEKYGDAGGTHPKPSVRIARVNAQIKQLQAKGYKPTVTLDRARFQAMRQRVIAAVKSGTERGSISFFSNEMAESSQSEALLKPMGCGPLWARPETAVKVYRQTFGVK